MAAEGELFKEGTEAEHAIRDFGLSIASHEASSQAGLLGTNSRIIHLPLQQVLPQCGIRTGDPAVGVNTNRRLSLLEVKIMTNVKGYQVCH